ncbi:MAG: DUF937 domain-containing protein [Saprospirales bacterium]|nr:DUF937 domain-containing protein [Saprospirales bacterium]MBK8489550.1 DUF937 domain-containing protein [Saprospirales bacterium]
MPNLMDLLQGQLSDSMIDQLSNQLGGANREQTALAANGIMSTLVSQIARNASSPEGASSLANALDRDHDGSVLDDLMGLIGGGAGQPQQNNALNGEGIINHVLGDRQGNIIDMISKMSGMDKGNTGNLMTMLAPMVMGMLGKQKRQQGLDIGGLTSLLTGELQQHKTSNNPTMNLISQFLDADGDGDIKDDVANMGMKFLGNLFKKK